MARRTRKQAATEWIREHDGTYRLRGRATPGEILDLAASLLEASMQRGETVSSPSDTRRYFMCRLGGREQEVFACLFLDNRHRVIACEEMFYGTIDGTSVHPREVIKKCLGYNAAAIILAHNHPSGAPEPSHADRALTQRLQAACALVDVRVLDHLVVAGVEVVSFAERGWL